MKDIDFDELDRAVSSVLQGTPSEAPATPSDEVSTPATQGTPEQSSQPATQTPTELADESSEEDSTAEVAENPTATNHTPAASPAVKRSGRFMDVMHPSSDMRTAAVSAPSREGVALNPLTTGPESQQSSGEDPGVTDTFDFSPETDGGIDFSAPQQSPFLPDAQVDKRPLGGAPAAVDNPFGDLLAKELSAEYEATTPEAPAPNELAPTSLSVDTLHEDPQEQLPPNPETALLPEELHTDLVAIESAEAQPTSTLPPEVAMISEPPVESPTPQPTSPVQGSIPQQYTEQPSTSDQSHTPIYDTEAVPQPLAHPAKKKSGWLVVVWIFLIVALAVGGVLGLHFLGYL